MQIIRQHRNICTMWVPRLQEKHIQNSAEIRPVVVISGARQTGKTSLVRRLFPNHKAIEK